MAIKLDLGKLVSPATFARHQATKTELARLHALPDRWLAAALLSLARSARADHPELQDPHSGVYAASFLWQVVPEAARRLGGKMLPNEATRYRHQDGREFRETLGVYLKNGELRLYMDPSDRERATPTALEILDHEFVNGNPVAMAADRIHPPPPAGEDREDWIARHMREVSRNRGHGDIASWSPGGGPEPEPEAPTPMFRP